MIKSQTGNNSPKAEQKSAERYALFALGELAWGALWAAYLQHTHSGRYLAARRTWITVVVGVGGTLAIARTIVSTAALLRLALAFVLSSLGIITRSLVNEWRMERTLYATDKGPALGKVDW